jgi:hypothetical protein
MAKVENAMPPHAAKATDSDVDLLLVPILIVVIVVFLDGGGRQMQNFAVAVE